MLIGLAGLKEIQKKAVELQAADFYAMLALELQAETLLRNQIRDSAEHARKEINDRYGAKGKWT
jgi:hypothetical protein